MCSDSGHPNLGVLLSGDSFCLASFFKVKLVAQASCRADENRNTIAKSVWLGLKLNAGHT